MFSVKRISLATGRVLKVIADGFATHREAELYAEGYGQDVSPKTTLRICPCTAPIGAKCAAAKRGS